MIVRSVKDLSAMVRDRRKELGWSQNDLASKVGVQRLWVSQFEAGKTTAHIGIVLRTLRVLNLELEIGSSSRMPSDHSLVPPLDLDALLEDNLNQNPK